MHVRRDIVKCTFPITVVVLNKNQTALEEVVKLAGRSNDYKEDFVPVDTFGLFSALNKGMYQMSHFILE